MNELTPRVDLQALVDHYEHPCFVLDARRRVLVVNLSFSDQLQVARDRVLGCSLTALIDGDIDLNSLHRRASQEPPFAGLVDLTQREHTRRICRDRHGAQRELQINTYPLRAASEQVFIGNLLLADPDDDNAAAPSGARPPAACDEMVGASAAFLRVREKLTNVAVTDAPVLLLGETGTGKELAATFVHGHSARRSAALVTVDCTTLCGELFESELFGHEPGAFTGSMGRKKGLFELADGGTLFLDEIGEMPGALQAKLLRALETGEYRPVGATATRRADTRIICATNRDLRSDPSFRRDLYYRIACLTVRLPTLAERTKDIPLLSRILLRRVSETVGYELSIDHAAVAVLTRHRYAGNIRELRNVVWACAAHARDGVITARTVAAVLQPHNQDEPQHAPQTLPADAPASETIAEGAGDGSLASPDSLTLADLEAEHLARLISQYDSNREEIAKALGVSVRTVYRKLKRHQLN